MSKFAPPSPPMIPARWHGGSQTPRGIVIHGTVSPCVKGGARAVARFFATETGKTSAHYVVDPAEIVQCVGDHSVAYHCGYNTGTIAVELCDPQTGPGARWDDDNHKAMLAGAARLVADLCLAYDIDPARPSTADLQAKGPHGIYGHNDSRLAFGHTTHSDPGPDFPWRDFLGEVRRLVAEAKIGQRQVDARKTTSSLRVVDWNVQKQRPGKTVLAELRNLAATADVMTLQEVAGYRTLLDQIDGFHVASFADDVAVLVRDGHEVKASCQLRVTSRGWFTVTGKRTGPKSVAACIVDGIGFASVHTPPTVQSRLKRKASPRRWAAYRELMASMPAVVAHLGARCVVAMDSNVDARTDKGMAGWPLATFKALGMRRHVPKDGTHGRRVIDYCFAKGVQVGTPRVVAGRFGSDHKPVRFDVTA